MHCEWEVPQNEQYDQFSSDIRKHQHQKDKMQHNLEHILSFYPCNQIRIQCNNKIRQNKNNKRHLIHTTTIPAKLNP